MILSITAQAASAPAEVVTLKTTDGVTVRGDWYRSESPKAVILLFHQAGSNRAEYSTIGPRLAEAGYSALAIDQRSGGTRFGSSNETVKALGHSTDFLEAQPDLEAALAWGSAHAAGRPVMIWGSSYSSSLVFLVAAKFPERVAAVLSFSPGEYLGSDDLVRKAAAKVSVPIFVTSAQDSEEIAAARSILATSSSKTRVQFVPTHGGVHGSSTLRTDRNASGAEEAWSAVLTFLGSVAGGEAGSHAGAAR